MMSRLRVTAFLLGVVACHDSAPARPQVIVIVDTDAPVLEQVYGDPAVSAEASIDTVRIDLLGPRDEPTVFREFSATSPLDWPLSFGIVPTDVEIPTVARLRVRAFRARTASVGVEQGATTLTPPAELAIDRVVEIKMPGVGVDYRLVRLAADCFGWPPSFRSRTSCASATRRAASFAEELPIVEEPAVGLRSTAVGTWPRARAVACAALPREGRVCIPGGISVLGSQALVGLDDGATAQSPVPARFARVDPFFMDRTEFTVGRARPWLSRLTTTPPHVRGEPSVQGALDCTFTADAESDGLPLNCIGPDAARELCTFEGGDLPTEAQWNHAASGRGEGRRFPWGDESGSCCVVSAGRRVRGPARTIPACPGEGVEPVGSHLGCDGVGDVSRDGVVDLGGSLSELLRDTPQPLDDECWGDPFGILENPTCTKQTAIASVGTRGGDWSGGLPDTHVAFRRSNVSGFTLGFRCVYPDGTP